MFYNISLTVGLRVAVGNMDDKYVHEARHEMDTKLQLEREEMDKKVKQERVAVDKIIKQERQDRLTRKWTRSFSKSGRRWTTR